MTVREIWAIVFSIVFSVFKFCSAFGVEEGGLLSPGGSKAHYMVRPVRSLSACHVLLRPLTVLTAVLLRPTTFVIRIVTTGAHFLTV